jgi:hypothetical protein
MRKIIITLILTAWIAGWSASAHAETGAIAILKQGLLGAGTGAAASALTGAKGGDVWKGALTGMGVNVVGGALLDMVTTPSGTQRTVYMQQYQQYPQQVYQQVPQQAYYQEAPQRVVMNRQDQRRRARELMRRRAYQTSYNSDYLYGYQDGYQDGVNDAKYGY